MVFRTEWSYLETCKRNTKFFFTPRFFWNTPSKERSLVSLYLTSLVTVNASNNCTWWKARKGYCRKTGWWEYWVSTSYLFHTSAQWSPAHTCTCWERRRCRRSDTDHHTRLRVEQRIHASVFNWDLQIQFTPLRLIVMQKFFFFNLISTCCLQCNTLVITMKYNYHLVLYWVSNRKPAQAGLRS